MQNNTSEIELIFECAKRLGLNVELQRASEELGFYPDLDFPVIVGKSEIGQMLLYREDDDSDFVFTVTYIGGALKTEKYAHWHPNDSAQAFEDTKAFMTDDRKYFLQFGLSL